MRQETPRKYTKPTYTKKRPTRRPMARWKEDVEKDIKDGNCELQTSIAGQGRTEESN
jgi:hypothetical protein